MATTTTFDWETAARDAEEKVGLIAADRQAQLLREADEAVAMARTYAEHLAEGGDPLDHPKPEGYTSFGKSDRIVSPFLSLIPVYEAWNEARGVPNPTLPFSATHEDWRMMEYVATRIGEPIAYAVLKRGRISGVSSDAIAGRLLRFEAAGLLVVRRTRVDGKVGFLVRERRPDDPEQGSYRATSLPEEA